MFGIGYDSTYTSGGVKISLRFGSLLRSDFIEFSLRKYKVVSGSTLCARKKNGKRIPQLGNDFQIEKFL
jgi:hypothetical protein